MFSSCYYGLYGFIGADSGDCLGVLCICLGCLDMGRWRKLLWILLGILLVLAIVFGGSSSSSSRRVVVKPIWDEHRGAYMTPYGVIIVVSRRFVRGYTMYEAD